ncbi:hypothetical protein J6590_003430 [Homalodisca vitripennis]|nr:hypothetical protein J6590_003430 [Homalodisca vitripennis]
MNSEWKHVSRINNRCCNRSWKQLVVLSHAIRSTFCTCKLSRLPLLSRLQELPLVTHLMKGLSTLRHLGRTTTFCIQRPPEHTTTSRTHNNLQDTQRPPVYTTTTREHNVLQCTQRPPGNTTSSSVHNDHQGTQRPSVYTMTSRIYNKLQDTQWNTTTFCLHNDLQDTQQPSGHTMSSSVHNDHQGTQRPSVYTMTSRIYNKLQDTQCPPVYTTTTREHNDLLFNNDLQDIQQTSGHTTSSSVHNDHQDTQVLQCTQRPPGNTTTFCLHNDLQDIQQTSGHTMSSSVHNDHQGTQRPSVYTMTSRIYNKLQDKQRASEYTTTFRAYNDLLGHTTTSYTTTTITVIQRLSQDNQIKHRPVWLLLGWVTAERSCSCKQPACPAIGGGSEVTSKPLVPRLSVTKGFLALTPPESPRLALSNSCELGFNSYLSSLRCVSACIQTWSISLAFLRLGFLYRIFPLLRVFYWGTFEAMTVKLELEQTEPKLNPRPEFQGKPNPPIHLRYCTNIWNFKPIAIVRVQSIRLPHSERDTPITNIDDDIHKLRSLPSIKLEVTKSTEGTSTNKARLDELEFMGAAVAIEIYDTVAAEKLGARKSRPENNRLQLFKIKVNVIKQVIISDGTRVPWTS